MLNGAPLLILRHEPFEHLGYFAEILEEKRIAYQYHDLGKPLESPEFKGLIVMGGPMSANDDLPGLREELRLIDLALKENSPILGICLGAQMIAKSLGSRVYCNAELEIGWEPVWFTEAAMEDPMFGEMGSPEMFFHWHGETFDLPAGAQWLAYSKKCRHQAYRYGERVYGIQFHPEITAEMIEDWCGQPVNCGDVALTGPIDARAHNGSGSARRILDAWLGLV